MIQPEWDELYLAGLERDEAGDHDGALALFRRGAELGDASAYNAIGIAYDAGRGVAQDKWAAIEWFVKAWNDGENPGYGANIAKTYDELDEWEQAELWWRRALESGDKGAGLQYAKSLMERGATRRLCAPGATHRGRGQRRAAHGSFGKREARGPSAAAQLAPPPRER